MDKKTKLFVRILCGFLAVAMGFSLIYSLILTLLF